MLKTITSPAQVEAGILNLNSALDQIARLDRRDAADLVQALSRAHEWVAIQSRGKWLVGFSKFVGFAGHTPKSYRANRKTTSGTESDRAIKKLGGKQYAVGALVNNLPQNHPAVQAVKDLCNRHGKQPNSLARVYVLDGQDITEVEREKIKMAVALIESASLSKEGRAHLIDQISQIA